MFNEGDLVKYNNQLGVILHSSKLCRKAFLNSVVEYFSFNSVYLEDKTIRMCEDEELELVENDRTTEDNQ